GDVLPPSDLVGDNSAPDWPAGIEAIPDRPARGVERDQVPSQLARENQSPGGRRDSRDDRTRRSIAPPYYPCDSVDGRDPPLSLLVTDTASAHERLARHVADVLVHVKRVAPVDGGHDEEIEAGMVGRPVPLHTANEARARARTFRGDRRGDVLDRRHRR